ncbi:MAG TPA: hypothetical protein ENF17_05140 [Candidatus Aminicenantes bacterium]|nr:hypothetical protein [Candidatus Aminicenantes bacterium]
MNTKKGTSLNEDEKIYRLSFEIHTYEVDFRGRAHLQALLCFLQEAAARQATHLGFGYDHLVKKGLVWLLSRYHLKINRYPWLGEKIEILTWPSGDQGVFALRDFEVRDQRGATILVATSSWVLWDVKAKQPKLVEILKHSNVVREKRALRDNFEPLPALEKIDYQQEFKVMMKHLDLNRHVNNTVYIQWAIESIPPEILLRLFPLEVEISYKAEAFFAEEVVSRLQQVQESPLLNQANPNLNGDNYLFIHSIVNHKKGHELARLRTIWGNLSEASSFPSAPIHSQIK